MSDEKKQGDENWRDATAEDVAEIIKTGKPIPARFRDDEKAKWFISELAGWTAGMIQWYSTDDDLWAQCQVYREPAPTRSPKDGCRMLEDNEEPMPGDFIDWGAGWNYLGEGFFPSLAVAAPAWYCRPIKATVEEIGKNVGPEVIEAFSPVVVQPESTQKKYREPTLADLADGPIDCEVRDNDRQKWHPAVLHQVHPDILARYKTTDTRKSHHVCGWAHCRIEVPVVPCKSDRPVPKGFRLLGDEPRLASDGYWSQSCKDWIVIGDRVEYANRDKWPAIRFVVDAPEPVKHQSRDPASVFGSNPIEVRPIMQIRLPVPASVLGKLGDMLEKHYPGSTMRQAGGFLVFEEPIEL
jgi:hypothetical protein